MTFSVYKRLFRKALKYRIVSIIPAWAVFTVALLTASISFSDGSTYEHSIALSELSKLRLVYTEDHALDIFHDSLGVFYEIDSSSSGPASGGPFFLDTRLFSGLVNAPHMTGLEFYKGRVRSDLERSLFLVGTQIGVGFDDEYSFSEGAGIRIGLRTDGFLRFAYNLYDLAPSVDEISSGKSPSQVFSNYFSGISYSTLQNRVAANIGVYSDMNYYGLTYETKLTDFIYNESVAGLSFSRENEFRLSLYYDWASYDTRNGVASEGIRGRLDLEGLSSVLSFEAEYTTDGFFGIGIYGTVSLDGPRKEHDRTLLEKANTTPSNISGATGADKIERRIGKAAMDEAKEIAWDQSLLERKDLSMEEIGAVLKIHDISEKYDYSRVVGLDYTDILSPEEYIERGGICRDAANTVANILINNGYEAKVVYSKQANGTPHAYVVTRDHDGAYYIFDYDTMYEASGTQNMQQTASVYSKALLLLLMDPDTHRVTDIVETPDAVYLDQIAGMR